MIIFNFKELVFLVKPCQELLVNCYTRSLLLPETCFAQPTCCRLNQTRVLQQIALVKRRTKNVSSLQNVNMFHHESTVSSIDNEVQIVSFPSEIRNFLVHFQFSALFDFLILFILAIFYPPLDCYILFLQ